MAGLTSKKYNPKEVIAVVGGYSVSGWGPDTMIEVTRNEDDTTLTVGNSGSNGATFNINPNKSGVIKFTLLTNSDSTKVLSAMFAQKYVAIPILVNNTNEKLSGKVVASDCMIKKVPDITYGKEIGTVDFEFNCSQILMFGA